MRMPSRVTPYKKSTLAEFPTVLKELRVIDMSPIELYKKVEKKIPIADFVEVLDCLYILGRVELDEKKEVLHYVERNTMQ
jgi:hypothetical protein